MILDPLLDWARFPQKLLSTLVTLNPSIGSGKKPISSQRVHTHQWDFKDPKGARWLGPSEAMSKFVGDIGRYSLT